MTDDDESGSALFAAMGRGKGGIAIAGSRGREDDRSTFSNVSNMNPPLFAYGSNGNMSQVGSSNASHGRLTPTSNTDGYLADALATDGYSEGLRRTRNRVILAQTSVAVAQAAFDSAQTSVAVAQAVFNSAKYNLATSVNKLKNALNHLQSMEEYDDVSVRVRVGGIVAVPRLRALRVRDGEAGSRVRPSHVMSVKLEDPTNDTKFDRAMERVQSVLDRPLDLESDSESIDSTAVKKCATNHSSTGSED
mmetsp:Transcript_3518/g.7891  ORF Transcript_3518/g.7891 Transcript_3518/m.7891 type:complete len:249 (+) Transcript_3518:318-1064(+)